jgi:hypothetical protein
MRIPTLSAKRKLSLIVISALVLAGGVSFAETGQAAAVVAKATAVPATGPSLAATTLVLTGTGFKTGTVKNVGSVTFQTGTACSTSPSGEAATSTAVTSATKLVTATPNDLVVGAVKICVYDTTTPSAVLIAAGSYTTFAAPTVGQVAPDAGTVSGGAAITIVGTNFTSKSTATVGGAAVTGLKFVSATKLTGVVPSHAAGASNVVVKTEGGASAVDTVTPITYNYKNAIMLAGDTSGPSGFLADGVTPVADTTIDITGLGFSDLDFAGGTATVALVPGVWAADNPGTNCLNITKVSDTEIVCAVPGSTMTEGAYIVTVVNTVAPEQFQSVVSSSAAFIVAAF